MTNKLPIGVSTALAIALGLISVFAAGPAAALGLGQISVKSQRDQPLLAEIPIISSDPAELEQLQARLASPETFRRVGLEPPQGVTAELRFAVALDSQGQPVIRVTTAVPVQQPLLTFLLEVDWGQGRLVREYSALLDAPRTVSAPVQPTIQAPTVAPPNTIMRPVPAPVVAAPLPESVAPPPLVPVAAAPQAEPSAPVNAIPIPPPATPVSDAVPAVAAPLPAPAAQTPGEYGPVQRGQTLGQIAGQLDVGAGYTLDQTMLALLRANPEAFIGDNINLIKQGAVLRVPPPTEVAQLNATEAAVVVRDQIEQWREARQPVLQPAAVTDAATQATSTPRRDAGRQPRVADARLAIVPPTANSGRRAGTRSGIDAGGEGDMLRQELAQNKETLAARDAEVDELKARVADLEKLQQQQQQLITFKDSELAAAQQRLATSNREGAVPAAAQTVPSTVQPVAPVPETADRSNGLIWLWGALALLVVGGLSWWFARRRHNGVPPRSTRGFDSAALAASMPTADRSSSPEAGLNAVDSETVDTRASTVEAIVETESKPVAPGTQYWSAPTLEAPTWHAGANEATVVAAVSTNVPAGNERLELARAYLDLGDDDAARTLLREVLDDRDPVARAEAARLLRDL